ncbi:LLM class flavin-dependent oxidoreductase [Streptomyces sp. NPDC020983]|uniref:LLM class flavin-dependent oxidoreductase n=1 Tax=Streptomyces sp. NPDC020983 TaxID=3365106 RepID=UPI0037981F66
MTARLALPMSATLSTARVSEVAGDAVRLEELGYRGLWVGEGRLRRDAVTQLALAASATRHCYLSSGIVPFRTRNVAVLAMTWKTLHQLAPGRVRLGLGAWWEPIASRAGVHTASPLTAMEEVVAVLRTLFAGGTATCHGKYVDVEEIRFDGVEDEAGATYPVPVYLAAVGPRMLELAARIADGVLLDFFLPAGYLSRTAPGALTARQSSPAPLDMPQLVACAVDDDDPGAAVNAMRVVLTRYLVQQPHIAAHSGADPELVTRLRRTLGWPATTGELREAARLVPIGLVREVAAVGTVRDVLSAMEERIAAGASEIVVAPFGDRRTETFEALARRTAVRPN